MIKIYKNLTKKEGLLAIASIIFIVLQSWLDLKMPDYMSEITMLVQTQGSEMAAILTAGAMMLLCALGSFVSAFLVTVFAARIATNFGCILRGKLFSKVQSFSLEEMGRFSSASLITRTTNDVMQVQMLIVMGLQSVVKAPITASLAIGKIAGKNGTWTFSTAVAVVLLVLVVSVINMMVIPKFKQLQKMTDDLNRVTRENLTGIKVVRAYNAEKYQEEKFEVTNEALTRTHIFTGRTMAFMGPMITLIMSGLNLAIYIIGAYQIEKAGEVMKLPLFSDMVVFSQYAMQVVMSFMMLVMIFMIYPRALVSAKRINEVLDTVPTITDGAKTDEKEEGTIEFKNVSFSYPESGESMLADITFKVNKGETLAIIGATGSGKTTLINLIPRFFDATSGEVLVGGVNVKEYTQKALRGKIGYISQKANLFSGTVRSNVSFGKFDENADIKDAVSTAQAEEFVSKLENGYDGYISQRGENLSGGQKQRLSIARALYKNPEILIFDDSFSALDYKTDKVLRTRLKEDFKDATKIIVAQRIGTIMDADKIIVLDDGEIAGMGTHRELLESCEVYKQIAHSQLSEEELA